MRASDADISRWVSDLFDPRRNLNVPSELGVCLDAFINLACAQAEALSPKLVSILKFDEIGIAQFVARFHRDAYGVHNAICRLHELKIDPALVSTIEDIFADLSIRINSRDPKKTRVAAAFSLWLATIRPVFFSGTSCPGVSKKEMLHFLAFLNLWIACLFLMKFGTVTTRDLPDFDERMERIGHDFTYRAINLSSLEVFYCSVFRLNPAAAPAKA